MTTRRQTGNTSGLTLFNAHKHKVGVLDGLKIDNRYDKNVLVKIYDQFTTDASKTMAADAATAAEVLGTGHPLSGKVRFEGTIPAGEFDSFDKGDLEGMKFLGGCAVVTNYETSECVVIAQYHME